MQNGPFVGPWLEMDLLSQLQRQWKQSMKSQIDPMGLQQRWSMCIGAFGGGAFGGGCICRDIKERKPHAVIQPHIQLTSEQRDSASWLQRELLKKQTRQRYVTSQRQVQEMLPIHTATPEQLKRAFATFDDDGDGLLRSTELIQILTCPPRDGSAAAFSERQVKEMLRTLDPNGTGRLALETLAAYWVLLLLPPPSPLPPPQAQPPPPPRPSQQQQQHTIPVRACVREQQQQPKPTAPTPTPNVRITKCSQEHCGCSKQVGPPPALREPLGARTNQ